MTCWFAGVRVQGCHELRELRLADGCTPCFNRAVARLPLFRKEADYAAFERVMLEACERHPTRILAWCLMRNHWHFVIWPREEGCSDRESGCVPVSRPRLKTAYRR